MNFFFRTTDYRQQSTDFEYVVKLKSHVVTIEYKQAVECEARNPCIYDQTDIKSAVGTTETEFLSYLRHSDLF